ncbi:MAG: PIN domain-containing protein, partial [Nanoarchaeota archaeon]
SLNLILFCSGIAIVLDFLMEKRFYFDTSVWLDFFENRDEPNLPKGAWARKLISKIISKNDRILYSDLTIIELEEGGYSRYELDSLIMPLRKILIFLEATDKQIGISKDLSLKRKIPRKDALHALIARDSRAVLVTLDHHFKQITDIIVSYRTNELLRP